MIRSLLKGCITVSVWGWNLTFIILTQCIFGISVYYLFETRIRNDLPLHMLEGIPPSIPLAIITAATLPVIVIIAALRRPDQQGLITRLFYATQVPIWLICLLRVAALHEVNHAAGFTLISMLFAALFYAFRLLYPNLPETRESLFSLGLHGVLAALALYAGAIVCIAVPFIGWICVISLYNFIHRFIEYPHVIETLLYLLPTSAILFFSAVLLIYAPIGYILAYGRAWHKSKRRAARDHSAPLVRITAYGVPVLWFAILLALIPTPDRSLLTSYGPVAGTQAEKKALLAHEQDIRQSLKDAYLWRYRYFRDKESCENSGLFGPIPICPLLKPVMYPGAKDDDIRAADRYIEIFGVSIKDDERKDIRAALNATAYRHEAEADLLNIDERKVRLLEQDVTTHMQGPFIRAEIHETYSNITQTAQEVVYYFTLPENAAVTGLWLGSSPDKSRSNAFRITPRDTTPIDNNNEQHAIDPVLLEQTGPRQYRLRVFPVPGSTSKKEGGPQLHLWFSYVALQSAEQSVAPQLLHKRNVFWDRFTHRTMNGEWASTEDEVRTENGEWVSTGSTWIPQAAFPTAEPFTQPFTTESDSLRITARPAQAVPSNASAPAPVAVLVDSAYPMGSHKRDLLHALSFLRRADAKPQVIISPVNDQLRNTLLLEDKRQAERIIDDTVFFGPSEQSRLWRNAFELQRRTTYSAVFVLTQGGVHAPIRFQVKAKQEAKTPIWFIYTDRLPDALDGEVFHQTLASKGGAVTRIEEAYRRLIASRTLPASARLKGNVQWEIAPMSVKTHAFGPPSFGNMLAYAFAASEPDLLPGADAQKRMDEAHRLSSSHEVISPYSSMIALARLEQLNAFMQADMTKDRLEYPPKYDTETLTSAQVSAVPEPETWMLLGAGGILLIFLALRGRTSKRTCFR